MLHLLPPITLTPSCSYKKKNPAGRLNSFGISASCRLNYSVLIKPRESRGLGPEVLFIPVAEVSPSYK